MGCVWGLRLSYVPSAVGPLVRAGVGRGHASRVRDRLVQGHGVALVPRCLEAIRAERAARRVEALLCLGGPELPDPAGRYEMAVRVAIAHQPGRFQREPRLAAPADAREGYQARREQHSTDLFLVALATDERGQRR